MSTNNNNRVLEEMGGGGVGEHLIQCCVTQLKCRLDWFFAVVHILSNFRWPLTQICIYKSRLQINIYTNTSSFIKKSDILGCFETLTLAILNKLRCHAHF